MLLGKRPFVYGFVLIALSTGCDDSEASSAGGDPVMSGDGDTGAGGPASTPGEPGPGDPDPAEPDPMDDGMEPMDDGMEPMDDGMEPMGDTDYSIAANWLCRPDNNGACEQDLSTTVVAADGTTTAETYEPATDAPIDCFYVYPTVSLDTTPNSDLVPGPEEEAVVRAQFARLGSQCRLFAPMYRQVTLTALRASLGGGMGAGMPDRALGYNDVLAAWKYYLENDNDGRGVVLVGHSQGSGVLSQLISAELDTEAGDARFLGALLIGTNVLVPEGAVVGGTFEHVPLCESAEQLGCVVTYASFRDTAPPPSDSFFAVSRDPALVAACTNPAALGGGSAELHAYLNTQGPGVSSTPMAAWVEGGDPVEAPFVTPPGLLTAECVAGTAGSYLAVTVNADPEDPRADDISGDVVTDGEVQANWGLHLIDVHLAMGNLVDIVQAKATAHTSE